MGSFQLAVTIARPPHDVFALLADPRNMPRWYEAVEEVTATTGGPPAPGSRYEITRSLPGGRVRNDVEVTEYVPDRRITLESRRGPTPFRYRYDLEPGPDGTLLKLDATITADGLPGPAAQLGPLATQLFKRGMRQNLLVLKGLVESAG